MRNRLLFTQCLLSICLVYGKRVRNCQLYSTTNFVAQKQRAWMETACERTNNRLAFCPYKDDYSGESTEVSTEAPSIQRFANLLEQNNNNPPNEVNARAREIPSDDVTHDPFAILLSEATTKQPTVAFTTTTAAPQDNIFVRFSLVLTFAQSNAIVLQQQQSEERDHNKMLCDKYSDRYYHYCLNIDSHPAKLRDGLRKTCPKYEQQCNFAITTLSPGEFVS
jgi:hypothetical protein